MARRHIFLLIAQAAFLLVLGQNQDKRNLQNALQTYFDWTVIDYEWASHGEREAAIKNGTYDPSIVVPFDVEVKFVNPKDKNSCAKAEAIYIVTTPRVHPNGVPAVVSTIVTKDGQHNPRLKPFPNWEFNRKGNCHGFANVYRTRIDKCNRLWVLDAGTSGLVDKQTQQDICPPKILIFEDLTKGGKLLAVHTVPERVLRRNSVLIAFVLDSVTIDGPCNNMYAYISDTKSGGLIVFNEGNKSWSRCIHNSFFPDRNHGNFLVGGVPFQEMGGLQFQSISPLNNNGERIVYYRTFSSVTLSYVKASILRDQKAFQANERSYPQFFHTFPKESKTQVVIDFMNNQGIMFYNLLGENAVACWNSQRDPNYTNTPIVAQNNMTMQFLNGMKMYNNQFFTLSDRFQNYFYGGKASPNEINFRILFGCVTELTRGTACQSL